MPGPIAARPKTRPLPIDETSVPAASLLREDREIWHVHFLLSMDHGQWSACIACEI